MIKPLLILVLSSKLPSKGEKRGEVLASSSVSKIGISKPRSRPRPRKTSDKDLGPRLVLVRRPLENLCVYFHIREDIHIKLARRGQGGFPGS